MKKRFTIALAPCFVAALVFWRVRSNAYIEPPTQRPAPKVLNEMFPADSRAIFENAERMTLYSIKKMPMVGEANTFHDYPVIGKTEISDAKTRRDLVAHFYHGIATKDEFSAACFNPRHAIRASKGSKTVDLVICFSCTGIHVHHGNETGRAYTKRITQRFYDSVLTQAGVPLAP